MDDLDKLDITLDITKRGAIYYCPQCDTEGSTKEMMVSYEHKTPKGIRYTVWSCKKCLTKKLE